MQQYTQKVAKSTFLFAIFSMLHIMVHGSETQFKIKITVQSNTIPGDQQIPTNRFDDKYGKSIPDYSYSTSRNPKTISNVLIWIDNLDQEYTNAIVKHEESIIPVVSINGNYSPRCSLARPNDLIQWLNLAPYSDVVGSDFTEQNISKNYDIQQKYFKCDKYDKPLTLFSQTYPWMNAVVFVQRKSKCCIVIDNTAVLTIDKSLLTKTSRLHIWHDKFKPECFSTNSECLLPFGKGVFTIDHNKIMLENDIQFDLLSPK